MTKIFKKLNNIFNKKYHLDENELQEILWEKLIDMKKNDYAAIIIKSPEKKTTFNIICGKNQKEPESEIEFIEEFEKILKFSYSDFIIHVDNRSLENRRNQLMDFYSDTMEKLNKNTVKN